MNLNKGCLRRGLTKRKLAVLFFLLLGGGLSMYYISEAVTGILLEKHKRPLPAPVHFEGSETVPDGGSRNKERSPGSETFHQYLDSLKIYHPLDSKHILVSRPDLIDSVSRFRKYYPSIR